MNAGNKDLRYQGGAIIPHHISSGANTEGYTRIAVATAITTATNKGHGKSYNGINNYKKQE